MPHDGRITNQFGVFCITVAVTEAFILRSTIPPVPLDIVPGDINIQHDGVHLTSEYQMKSWYSDLLHKIPDPTPAIKDMVNSVSGFFGWKGIQT
ncbi:unnamed protein product [Nezara viridula]|uniref:Uncharacterized protein n=1 Tax=Nezara viridula TaxID=85310 RepID=A0A9P0HPJ5_NEZVI|nr:unnamed protein product [Nezara viridula]